MGKAALLIVFGAALFVAQGMLSQSETERHTAKAQAGFEEGIVAREIARSGFNVAMGILRENGNKIHKAINEINKQGTGLGYMEGSHQGGTFRVQAVLEDGEVVRVTSVGYIGGSFSQIASDTGCREADPFTGEYYSGACHTMADFTGESPVYEYELPSGDPLTAKYECSRLDVEFLESDAGYCSAVFMERILATSVDGAEDPNAGTPEPAEMLFVPGKNRDNTTLAGVDKYIRGGTQMNFFIGVDENCVLQPTATGVTVEDYPDFTGNAANPAPYNHLRYALQEEVGKLGDMSETPWAFTEMHPSGIEGNGEQRWRIAFEDMDVAGWDDPDSNDPSSSLQALKSYGYNGDGWTDVDSDGYRRLRNVSGGPDFNDQVIEVSLAEETDISMCYPADTSGTSTPTEPVPDPADCDCPKHAWQDHKVAVWHKLENQKKGRVICIAESAVQSHLDLHEDHVVCRGN